MKWMGAPHGGGVLRMVLEMPAMYPLLEAEVTPQRTGYVWS